MLIREENKNDYKKVYEVIKNAFKTAKHSDGKEQDLVVDLRCSAAFIPQLSLVAEIDDNIVGHILFTKNRIGNHIGLTLAPLSVIPRFQNQGIGTTLIKEGHKIAKNLGYKYIVVLGSEKYYKKSGYVPASNLGIKAPFNVSEENFMAINLYGDNELLNEIVEYPKEFII